MTWAGVTCPARVDAQPQAPHIHGPRPSPPLHPCAVPGSEHPRLGAHHEGIPTATPAGGQPLATQPAPATILNPRALEPRSPAFRGAGACTPGVPSPGLRSAATHEPGQRMSSCGGGGGGDGAQHPPPRGRTPILPHHSPQPTPQRPPPHPHQPKKRKKGEKGEKTTKKKTLQALEQQANSPATYPDVGERLGVFLGRFLGGPGRKPPTFHADRRLQTVCCSCNEILIFPPFFLSLAPLFFFSAVCESRKLEQSGRACSLPLLHYSPGGVQSV